MATEDTAPAADAAEDTNLPDGLPANDPNGESTTPKEVAEIMGRGGVDIPEADIATDAEEGDDPDAEEGETDTEEADTTEADESEEADTTPEDEEDDTPTPTDEEVQAAQEARTTELADKYSFEVEDANGVTFKITPDVKMEDVLAEFQPKNNGQVIDILDQLREAKEQKVSDEAEEAKQTAAAEQAQRASEIRSGWDQEVKDLAADKRLPDGDDGDKRVADVFKYMSEENDKRAEAGRPLLSTFEDALDKLEAKETRDAKVAADKQEKEDARKKGGLVGGSSAATTSATPVYRAGSARNSNEAIRSLGLL